MTTTDMHKTKEHDDCLFCQDHLEEAAMRTLESDVQYRMESHLARCSMCRAELAQIEESLKWLAITVDQVEPSANVKSAFMARFQAERDAGTSEEPLASPGMEHPRPSGDSPPTSRGRAPWSYGALVAGIAVALLLIGAWNFLPIRQSGGDLPAGQIQVMAMENTCPDCHDETGGHIGADPTEKDGLVVAWNLDPARKHEVWCVNRDGKHTKIGDLNVEQSGSVMQKMSFPDEVGGYQQIYVVRDDGAEELTVAPGASKVTDSDPPALEPTPAE